MMNEVDPGRIQLLDVLRGGAILGTLATTIWSFSLAADPTAAFALLFGGAAWWASLDVFLATAVLVVTNGKFFGLLTVLFGVGLEIQYQSARRRGAPWPLPYLWRSALLLAEGFLHYLLVFEFDILMGYAVVAAIVALLVGRGERALRRAMWIAGGLHLVPLVLLSLALLVPAFLPGASVSIETGDDVDGDAAVAAAVYTTGSWPEQVAYRLDNLLALRIEPVAIIPLNVFLFCLGVRLMRAGAFAPDEPGARSGGGGGAGGSCWASR